MIEFIKKLPTTEGFYWAKVKTLDGNKTELVHAKRDLRGVLLVCSFHSKMYVAPEFYYDYSAPIEQPDQPILEVKKPEDLKREAVYLDKFGKEIVFKHISQTGAAVFQPPGEPSFQDCFILKDVTNLKFVRIATQEDLGG